MAKRKVVKIGDELLRKKSKPVKDFDDELIELLEDMKETMYENDGMGLAAPQVGVLRRVIVMDVNGNYYELINPEIIETSGEICDVEGCLSVPGESGKVNRPEYVKIKAQNRNGVWRRYEGTGLKARCFCHEIDHLDGILYTDKVVKDVTADDIKNNK